jgi:bacterioferritin (cytochrome b1)
MAIQSESLIKVLRCEMTAVNQQFIHVLALRDWGYDETAERIMQVDLVDFPNAMRIINHLVESEAPIPLASDRFTPGTSYRSILVAEQAIEQRLCAAIEDADGTDNQGKALIRAAREPRGAYAAWLAGKLNEPSGDEGPAKERFPETADVFACLIAMIEQAMVHAFVHWHRGTAENADAAWATGGAAMMYATEFVHLFAAHHTVPVPGDIPALQIASDPAAALGFDRQLARRCADEAAAASDACRETAIAELCRGIADCTQRLSAWSSEQPHPAAGDNPPAFSSFEKTLTKYVWPKGSTLAQQGAER